MEPQEQKNKILKPLLAILVGVVLIGATGFGVWYWQNGENIKQRSDTDIKIAGLQKQIDESKQTPPAAEPAKKTKTNPLVYLNNQEGFQLTFPENWRGYGTSEILWDDGVKSIHFGLPVKEPFLPEQYFGFERNYNDFFALSIHTKDGWAKASAQEGPKGQKIAESDNKVYVYTHANGTSGELKTGSILEASNAVDGIIASFKLLE